MNKLTLAYSEIEEFSHELLKDGKAFSYALSLFEDKGLIPVASEEFDFHSLFYFGKTNGRNDKLITFKYLSSFKSKP